MESIIGIERYLQYCDIWSKIASPSELIRTINLFNIYIELMSSHKLMN